MYVCTCIYTRLSLESVEGVENDKFAEAVIIYICTYMITHMYICICTNMLYPSSSERFKEADCDKDAQAAIIYMYTYMNIHICMYVYV